MTPSLAVLWPDQREILEELESRINKLFEESKASTKFKYTQKTIYHLPTILKTTLQSKTKVNWQKFLEKQR